MVSAKYMYVIVFIMVLETVNKAYSKQFISISIKIDFKLTVKTEYVIGTGRIVMVGFCRCFKCLCKYSSLLRHNSIVKIIGNSILRLKHAENGHVDSSKQHKICMKTV